METWVDSSLVDIFTPGDYKATYTIKYEGKEYTKDIVVTIITKENSGENNGTPKDNSQETTANGNENVPNGNGSQNNTNTPDRNDSQSNTNTPNGNGSQDTTSKPNSGNQSDNKPQPTTKNTNQPTTKNTNQTTTKNTNQTTAKRQIVTSSGNATTAYQELGYYSIELLSGKTVKLKGSTSKYIVSTHTDISYVTKNNNKYKVSKLIVNFNDGTSRVLETVEEKVQ